MQTELKAYDPKFRCQASAKLYGSGIAHIDADDITQELAIAEWLNGYEALEWKADRLCRDAIRKERALQRGGTRTKIYLDPTKEPETRCDTLLAIMEQESIEAITEAIEGLPEAYAEVIRLRFFEAKTFGEIAAITERSPRSVANVAAKLKNAIEHLRDAIASKYADGALLVG